MTAAKPQQDSAFLQARRALLLDHCFFGSLIMHLAPVEDDKAERGVWVDGQTLGYNPESLAKMELLEGAGVLGKGVLSCALGAHLRRGVRDEKLWNQAVDLVLNPEIIDSGLALPKGADSDRSYQGKSFEQTYSILEELAQKQNKGGGKQGQGQGQGGAGQPQPQQQPGQGQPGKGKGKGQPQPQQPGQGKGSPQQGQGSGQPQTGEVRDLPGPHEGAAAGEAAKTEQEKEWKINMQQALQNAKNRGNLPGNFKRLIEKELEPRVSWKAELRRYMQATSTASLSWSRMNRRFMGCGVHLPAARSERMGTMVVVNDTSGSTAHAQEVFYAELKQVIEDVNPERVIFVQQDARIQKVTELEPGDELTCDVHGMGGTDFRPVFKWIEKEGHDPVCMVFLTDLDGPFPKDEPPYPVIWASVGSRTEVPFGDVIQVDVTQ
jgi:predicted metal-dependent peptidase